MTAPRTVSGDELNCIRNQFKQNKDADVIENVNPVRLTDNHALVERVVGTAK